MDSIAAKGELGYRKDGELIDPVVIFIYQIPWTGDQSREFEAGEWRGIKRPVLKGAWRSVVRPPSCICGERA